MATALLPEDRDVADERKRVLECQPIIESMVGSPLILQELSKVSGLAVFCLFAKVLTYFLNTWTECPNFEIHVKLLSPLHRCTAAGRVSWLWTGCLSL